MKVFIAILALLAVANARKLDFDGVVNKIKGFTKDADSSSEEIEKLFESGLKETTQQIELAVCKRNGTKLYEATVQAIECAKKDRPTGAICDNYNAQFKKCITPIEKVFEECAEAKYHDVPKLIVDSLTSTVEYLCNSKVRDVIELFNPCTVDAQDELKSCLGNAPAKYQDLSKINNIKTEMCNDFIGTKDCLLKAVNKVCPNAVTQKSFSDFYEALAIKPCKA